MDTIFDIFKRIQDGKSLWITTVEGLDEAKKRTNHLADIAPGEYLIYSQKKGIVVEHVIH